MAVFSVEGKLGTGKSKFAVWRLQQAHKEGRRIAGNVDVFLEHFAPEDWRARYVRLPDKPSAFDLEALGHGNPDSYDEDRNGVLILDELATWLNARSFADKSRAALLDWLVHARKLGWDVYLIVQDSNMIDRQVREALIEYRCKCLRLDKVKLPFVGGWLNDIGAAVAGHRGRRWGYLPRMHRVAARIGEGASAVVAEKWSYLGDWLHAAYDTRQVFRADYPHGAHTVLHPRYFEDKPPRVAWWRRLAAVLGAGRAAAGAEHRRRPAVLKPKLPAVAALEALPADQRVRAWRDLAAAGVL